MTKLTTLALLLTLTVAGCDKDKDNDSEAPAGKGKIAFQEFESVAFVSGKCQIDAANSKLRSTPIVSNDEIIQYNMDAAGWHVKESAWQRLSALKDGHPLAITLNGKVVYYFVYKPMYSSSTCNESITMQLWSQLPGFYAENTVKMTLGYPAPLSGITDRRNTPILIHELKAQKKLQ